MRLSVLLHTFRVSVVFHPNLDQMSIDCREYCIWGIVLGVQKHLVCLDLEGTIELLALHAYYCVRRTYFRALR